MTTPNTYTNWPNLRSLATVPTSIELLGTTSSNEPVRFLASLLAAQIAAGEDGASVRAAYRRTRTATRPVQPTGTRDLSTGVVTLSAPWEWDGPPTGADPYIWVSIANVPADRSMAASFDTAFRLNGVDGDDGAPGTNGDDGANGAGFEIIYREGLTTDTTVPTTPTGGTRGNNGLLDTFPTGWGRTPPIGAGYSWASIVGLPAIRTSAPVYSRPFLYGGPAGTQTFMVFQWTNSATTQPTQPTAGTTTVNTDGTALTSTGNSWYHPGNLPDRVEAQPFLWASIALRNPTTGNTTFGAPFRLNTRDGEDGDDGAQGARGDDGRSFVVLYYGNDDPDSGPTDPTTWRREADGTPDFNNPPSGWSTTVPSNRHIWLIVATVPGDITTAISFRSSFRVTGLDGADGAASAAGNSLQLIFNRSATAPDAPTGGTRNTDGTVSALPNGWSSSIPSGDDTLYASAMTIPGDRAAALVYSGVFQLSGVDGPRGAQGINGYGTVPLYYQLTEGMTPARPTGGSYTGGVLTPPSPWVLNEPAEQPGLDVWTVFAVIAPDGGLTYSQPHLPGQDGTDGRDGERGDDGGDGIGTTVIFQRGAIRPTTPTGGSFDRSTGAFTPPTGWSLTVPAGTDVLWGTFVRIGIGFPIPIEYSGVFTLGEALNITEIRNDLAALSGNDRLPASAISGLNEHLDPRVDALEAATVDLNAVQGRLTEDHDTTDNIEITLTEDEDPATLPDNRWAKNVLANGRAQTLWLRVPETSNLHDPSIASIDLRNYVIQVTNPDESLIEREFPASSFDTFASDTSTTYDYIRQGGTSVPVYTWLNTSHVRIRKYQEGVDRHSIYTGVTVVPGVGSVAEDQRVYGELRRNSRGNLEVWKDIDYPSTGVMEHGTTDVWRRVGQNDHVNQLDAITLNAPGWSTAGTIRRHGRSLGMTGVGVVAARTNSIPLWASLTGSQIAGVDSTYLQAKPETDGTVVQLGGTDHHTFQAPDGARVRIWHPQFPSVFDFDVTVMLGNSRQHLGEQPAQLWLDVMVRPGAFDGQVITYGTPRPILRGPVVTTRYYEPVELKVTGRAGVSNYDQVYIAVHDAFGVIAWEFVQGEMRIGMTDDIHNPHATDWQRQFLPEYPENVSRHYDATASNRGYAQRTLTLFSRGLVAQTEADAIQAHSDQLFTGVLGPTTQASTTGLFVGEPTSAVQAFTTDMFTGTGANYRLTLKPNLPARWLPGTPPGLDNDHIGASGNNWRVVTARGEVDGNGISVDVIAQAPSDPHPGAGQIVILVDNDVPTPTWASSADLRSAITSIFDITDENGDAFPNDAPPDDTPINVPAPHSTFSTIFNLTGGVDKGYAASPGFRATFKETFTNAYYEGLAATYAEDRDPDGTSGNNWEITIARGTVPTMYEVNLVTQGASDPHEGFGHIAINVDNSIEHPRWGDSAILRDAILGIFDITDSDGNEVTIPDNTAIPAPDQNVASSHRVTVEMSGGADAVLDRTQVFTASWRREFGPAVPAFHTLFDGLADDVDQVGASGNGWRILIQRGIVTNEGGFSIEAQLQGNAHPHAGAGQIDVTIDNGIARPLWADSEAFREAMTSLLDFVGVPSTGIPGATVINAPPVDSSDVYVIQFAGGIEHSATPENGQVGDDPGPPERDVASLQAFTTINDADYANSGKGVRLTLKASVPNSSDPNSPFDFAGTRGNGFLLRLGIAASLNASVFTDSEGNPSILFLDLPLSTFTGRTDDPIYASDFLNTSNFPIVGRFFDFTHISDPAGNDQLQWVIPGFPAHGFRSPGDSVTYRFDSGVDAGTIVYTGAGFANDNNENPAFRVWHTSDPDPDSTHTLYVAHALATQNADLDWTYGNWTYFPSGLGEHHIQYATHPTGPWTGTDTDEVTGDRITGFWRHRNADGTWGPAIQLHDVNSGQWSFLGHYIIANDASDSDFSTTWQWQDNSNRDVTNHGRIITLSNGFSLNDYDEIGFEFEFWVDSHRVSSTPNDQLLMRYWASFPVLDNWTTPPPLFLEGFGSAGLPDPNYTVAWMLRRQGTGSNNDQMPVAFAGRPGEDSGYWFGGRRPSNLERWYSSDYLRGGMLNLMSLSTSDRRYVDRFAFFNRANNKDQAVRIWGKVK